MNRPFWVAVVLAAGLAADGQAKPPVPVPTPAETLALLSPNTLDALSGNLRGYLVRNLPQPLYEASPGWGEMKYVTRGVEWHGLKPERQRSHKNHGTWRKVRADSVHLADTLVFDLRNVQWPEPGRMTFEVFVAFDARVEAVQQEWHHGHKLYDGSARVRFRVKLRLACEAAARLEPTGGILPDAVVRFGVTRAGVSFDNVVTEHLAGFGGEMAKMMGAAVRGGLREWHPGLEQGMLAKAEQAIVKAGDAREVRINVVNLLSKKARTAASP